MKIFTAMSLAAGVLAFGAAQADAHMRKHSRADSPHYHGKRVKPQVRGYVSRGVGGYRFGYENPPFLYNNGPHGNYPFFDDRNFWERVQSDPLSTTTSPSGL